MYITIILKTNINICKIKKLSYLFASKKMYFNSLKLTFAVLLVIIAVIKCQIPKYKINSLIKY